MHISPPAQHLVLCTYLTQPMSSDDPCPSCTQSQAHKLALVGGLRERSGRRFDIVWRNRPDMVAVGHNWTAIRQTTSHFAPSEKAIDRAVLVPPVTRTGNLFEDIDLLFSVAAARHCEQFWFSIPKLYAAQHSFHPEQMLHSHMRLANITREFHALQNVYIYRCADWCHL